MSSPIHHTFGPHVDAAYMRKTLFVSYAPWHYLRGKSTDKLRKALQKRFDRDVALFSSGREALLALFRALDVRPGEEIIIQGYTCIVVPNAVHTAGASPVYADIDEATLNLTPETVKPLINARTRAVICQHTFGIPSDLKGLRALCDEHKILLIEDCAHMLPDAKGPQGVTQVGDYAILSFGRDKAISGIAGGAVLSRHAKQTNILRELERTAIHLPWWTVAVLLEYPARMRSLVRPLSGTPLLKPVLWLLKKLGLIVLVTTEDEKHGKMSPILHKIPNVCANLALYSLNKLERLNERRRMLTSFFTQYASTHSWPALRGIKSDMPLQKFPMFVDDAQGKRATLKKKNIHLDDGWTGCVICPDSVDMDSTSYRWGEDPVAEAACMQIFSLPTHPTMTLFEAQRLARAVDEVCKK